MLPERLGKVKRYSRRKKSLGIADLQGSSGSISGEDVRPAVVVQGIARWVVGERCGGVKHESD